MDEQKEESKEYSNEKLTNFLNGQLGFDDAMEISKEDMDKLKRPNGEKKVKYNDYEKEMEKKYLDKAKRQAEKESQKRLNQQVNSFVEQEENSLEEDVETEEDEEFIKNNFSSLKKSGAIITEEEYEEEQDSEGFKAKKKIDWKSPVNEKSVNEAIEKNPDVEIISTDNSLFLVRELPFIKFEHIALISAIGFGSFISGLAYFDILAPKVAILSFIIVSLVSASFLIMKRVFYLPNKTRKLILRLYGNGLTMLSCEKLFMGNKVSFSKNAEPSVVTNLRAHTELFSGHPLILAIEGYYENLDINKLMGGKISARSSSKVIATLDEANALGVKKERLKNMNVERVKDNPLLLVGVLLIIIILVGAIVTIGLPAVDSLKELQGSIASLADVVSKLQPVITQTAQNTGEQIVNAGG